MEIATPEEAAAALKVAQEAIGEDRSDAELGQFILEAAIQLGDRHNFLPSMLLESAAMATKNKEDEARENLEADRWGD
jgi:hypothetical protein